MLSKKILNSQLSCFLMFILTHGKTLNGDSVFTTSDNQLVKVLAIENAIKNVASLRGKPKLLFVTSCRAIKNDISETWNDPGVAIEEKDEKVIVLVMMKSLMIGSKSQMTLTLYLFLQMKKSTRPFVLHSIYSKCGEDI